MEKVYISRLEHFSPFADSIETLREKHLLLSEDSFEVENGILDLGEPLNIKEILGKKGLNFKDPMTKASSYVAKKLIEGVNMPSFDELGIIYVTEFGNFKSMLNLSNMVKVSEEPISTQIFPNATISTAAVTASIYLNARGLNITINGGALGALNALKIAKEYLTAGKLSACIILIGDDYHPYAIKDLMKAGNKCERYLSSVSGMLLTNYQPAEGNEKSYLLGDIFVESKFETAVQRLKDSCLEEKHFNHLAGYSNDDEIINLQIIDQMEQTSWLKDYKTYLGPAITFFQLIDCLKRLEEDKLLEKCNTITFDTFNAAGYFKIGRA